MMRSRSSENSNEEAEKRQFDVSAQDWDVDASTVNDIQHDNRMGEILSRVVYRLDKNCN